MDKRKISRIAAAALIASGMAYATPAFAVDTTAEEFVVGLSADFQAGNYALVLAKLNELKQLGFEGIVFDNQMITLDQLIALITSIQAGDMTGAAAAATLLAHLNSSDLVRFINGGILVASADLDVGTGGATTVGGAPTLGAPFPAGSAG